jgi:hypothetical protein
VSSHFHCIYKEINSILSTKSVHYCPIQNLLSSITFSKDLKIKIYEVIILPDFCGYEIYFLTPIKEHKLRVFEKKFLR